MYYLVANGDLYVPGHGRAGVIWVEFLVEDHDLPEFHTAEVVPGLEVERQPPGQELGCLIQQVFLSGSPFGVAVSDFLCVGGEETLELRVRHGQCGGVEPSHDGV